jgi:glutamyl-tRNA synthetase
MSPEDFHAAAKPYIQQAAAGMDTALIASLLQQRCEKLSDIPGQLGFLKELPEYELELFVNKKSKSDAASSIEMLEAAIPRVEQLSPWTKEGVHDGLMGLAEELGVKNAKLLWPVRIALSGQTVTPGGAVEICCLLGREEALRRLRLGLARLKAGQEG